MARVILSYPEAVYSVVAYEVDASEFKEATGITLNSAANFEIIEFIEEMKINGTGCGTYPFRQLGDPTVLDIERD